MQHRCIVNCYNRYLQLTTWIKGTEISENSLIKNCFTRIVLLKLLKLLNKLLSMEVILEQNKLYEQDNMVI